MPTIRSPFLKKSDPYIYRDHHTPCRMPGRDDYILKPARLEGRRRSESSAACEAEAAHNMRRQPKYTASQKKTRHSICGRNFVKCKPIFTILSLTDSQENSQEMRTRANYIQGGDADVSCTAWFRTTLLGVVIHVSPTCRTDAGSGPPPLNCLTFRPVVGQLSEVVPFLLLEQRCGMASPKPEAQCRQQRPQS